MTDINARIDWRPGMEISAQTFKELTANLDFKQRVTSCIANNNRIGILPNSEFKCHGAFVKNVLEIDQFKCMALLPSGKIIDADENVSIKIPILYGDKYYLTVSFGHDEIQFDKEEVTFIRPQYLYEIHTMEEIEGGDYLPIIKFNVSDGMFSIATTFIPPYLLINADNRFNTYIESYVAKISQLTEHPNLEDGEGKRCLLRYMFMLKSYDKQESTHDFMQFVQEIANAIDYYVMRPHTESVPDIPAYSKYDVEEWLSWFEGYLTGAKSVLDGVVLEDHSIDYEKMKQEIKADIYDRVYPELYEQLKKDILEKFNPDMEQQIKDALTTYVNDVLRNELNTSLQTELSTTLYDKLYHILYDALYNALFVPVEEEEQEEYVPQI